MLTKDTAICIRTTDYSETSQIVTFFARQSGKIGAIAKGSKRPKSAFDGPIEMLSAGKIIFTHRPQRKLATLTEFEHQPGFGNLSKNLFAMNCSLFAAELTNHLTTDYDPHPELFDAFLQFLHDITDQHDPLTLLILFQLTLLREVGLRPILNKCANCKCAFNDNWPKVYFSTIANGLTCRDCENSLPDRSGITTSAARILTDLKQIAHTNKETLQEIEKVLINHFTELLHRRPKMAKHILMAP